MAPGTANKNVFEIIGQISGVSDNEFNGKKYKEVEVIMSAQERAYFNIAEEKFPSDAEFMSTVRIVGGLRGREAAKKSAKDNLYVQHITTPFVTSCTLVK